jgi:hypothetical protein
LAVDGCVSLALVAHVAVTVAVNDSQIGRSGTPMTPESAAAIY